MEVGSLTGDLRTDKTAGCLQPSVDPEWFFDKGKTPGEIERARNICRGVGGKPACPFLNDCYEWGLKRERYGVWGGLGVKERARIRRERGIRIPVERAVIVVTHRPETSPSIHGEGSGVYQHTKNAEPLCAECLIYTRERNREYSRRSRGRAS